MTAHTTGHVAGHTTGFVLAASRVATPKEMVLDAFVKVEGGTVREIGRGVPSADGLPVVDLGDVIIAMGASTDSKVNRMRFLDHDYAAIADYELLRTTVDTAAELGKKVEVGNVFSADLFYSPQTQMLDVLARMKVLAIEMELAGIYGVAAEYGARAMGILTVSDVIPTGEAASAEERQTTFHDMMQIALETAHKL